MPWIPALLFDFGHLLKSVLRNGRDGVGLFPFLGFNVEDSSMLGGAYSRREPFWMEFCCAEEC
jgi:hypothetical protein